LMSLSKWEGKVKSGAGCPTYSFINCLLSGEEFYPIFNRKMGSSTAHPG
jgi:hypothetical protein